MLNRRLSLILMGASALVSPVLGDTGEDARFAAIAKRWLDQEMQFSPVTATQIGDHRFDDQIDDMSKEGRARRIAFFRHVLGELQGLDRSKLSRDNQVDFAILSNNLKADIWDDEVLQSWAWDALVWSDLVGRALYNLMAREFAPLRARLKNATMRMQKLPTLLAQMRSQIVPARVPSIHAATVAKQNKGVISIIDDMILSQTKVLDTPGQMALKAAADTLRKEVVEHQHWLDTVLVPRAKGDFRLGARLFDQKLAFTLNSNLTRKEIRARAEVAVKQARSEMHDVSVQALKKAGKPVPDGEQETIQAALEMAYADKPPRGAVVQTATDKLAEATEFVKAHDLITLPSAPVEVILMPEFRRGVAVAYCDSPGPLDKGQRTFYAVSPIPDSWTAKQTDSFLREYNTRGMADIAVHEAMPGHYVQLWHSNRNPSVVRSVLWSRSFVEGWGVYAENLMALEGFYNRDPLYRLVQLKVWLRSITNAIIDQAMHCDGMSEAELMKLLTETAFQEEREAAGKWDRARMSATQLSTYFVGASEHFETRARAEKQGVFKLKAYHDRILSFGSPPGRFAAALYFGWPVPS